MQEPMLQPFAKLIALIVVTALWLGSCPCTLYIVWVWCVVRKQSFLAERQALELRGRRMTPNSNRVKQLLLAELSKFVFIW